jgi:hypothetical protein
LVSSHRWVFCASADYVFVVGVLRVEATKLLLTDPKKQKTK